MAFVLFQLIDQFLLFTLVLTRLSGLVMTAPIIGTADVPARVRVFLAVALALLITPLQSSVGLIRPTNLVDYLVIVAGEMAIGAVLGLGIMVLLAGLQLAGQVIGQMSGMSLADVFNPSFESEIPVFSQLLYLVGLAAFTLLGGHRQVLAALLDTFQTIPPTHVGVSDSIGQTVATVMTQSFVLGIRAAAPAMVSLLLTTLVLGFISRTLPQLNILSMGFSLSSLVTFATLVVAAGAIVWLFQEQIEPTLELLSEAFQRRA